ncbi:MAG: rhodanese-like domain-containing protein [Pseudomonadota bacterium]
MSLWMVRISRYLGLISAAFLLSVSTAQAEYREIGNEQLKSLLDQGVAIIDVRRADEWAETGVIETSLQATFFDRFGRFDAESWLNQIDGAQFKNKPVILICHSGVRSRVIGRWLSSVMNYEQVYNVQRGIVDWIRVDHKTVPWDPAAD